jgi:protein-S-isoprenylcysteine O-methyltransferase Ste14
VTPLGWLAAAVLFLQLPIPLYWFVVHPQVGFWRHHQKAAYITGLLCSWPPVTACIFLFRKELFRSDWPPVWAALIGFALIIFEGWLFWRLSRDLGAARLVGKAELSGAGSIATHGIYARIRHPRYAGSLLAILGACFLAGKPAMWIVAAAWTALMLVAISFEEREMRRRFGPAFEDYARRVPRFIPRSIPRF